MLRSDGLMVLFNKVFSSYLLNEFNGKESN